jgi:hypothetical protein
MGYSLLEVCFALQLWQSISWSCISYIVRSDPPTRRLRVFVRGLHHGVKAAGPFGISFVRHLIMSEPDLVAPGSYRYARLNRSRSHPRELTCQTRGCLVLFDPQRTPGVLLGTDQSLSSYPRSSANWQEATGIAGSKFLGQAMW